MDKNLTKNLDYAIGSATLGVKKNIYNKAGKYEHSLPFRSTRLLMTRLPP
jgi:hypothetical protein